MFNAVLISMVFRGASDPRRPRPSGTSIQVEFANGRPFPHFSSAIPTVFKRNTHADLRWLRECYYESDIHERNPCADPTNACDLSAVAPAVVVTVGPDPLRDGGKAYAEQLVRDGVRTRGTRTMTTWFTDS